MIYNDNVDIEDSIENYYRNIIADEIVDSMLYRTQDDENIERVKWFNEGLRYASMIARHGL